MASALGLLVNVSGYRVRTFWPASKRRRLLVVFCAAEVSDSPLLDLANIIEVKRTGDGLIVFTTLSGEGSAHRRERIGYDTSRDGLRWSRPKEIVSSQPTGFDSWGCMSPTVVQEADRWVLFYTALENSSERPEKRWGLSLGQGGWLFGTLGRAESPAPK